jgi:hypothetical protein
MDISAVPTAVGKFPPNDGRVWCRYGHAVASEPGQSQVDQERIPEQRHGNQGDGLGKSWTNPVQKGHHFCHQHLGFGLPALLLVRMLEAGCKVHCLVCLVIEMGEIRVQLERRSPCERLGGELG